MSKRILIVDDDEMVLMAVNELLNQEGYDVQSASSGSEALKKLEENSYDLIMLDIIMPEMDGFSVCKKIRAKDNCEEIPIVFLSAKSSEADKSDGLDAGANLFLSKPISPDKLIEVISQTIG